MTFDPAFLFYRDAREIHALETLDDMAAEAEAELAARHRLYPNMVQKGRLSRADADRELRVMGALADQLAGAKARAGQPSRGSASWTEIIHCLRREIALRRQLYPGWIAAGRVDAAEADRKLRVMESIHVMEWTMTWHDEAIAARKATTARHSGDRAA